MKELALFKSHYSIGRSILTLEKAGDSKPSEPDSIIDLAKSVDLKKTVIVEDNIAGFPEAEANTQGIKSQLIYGLRFTFVPDATVKTEATLKDSCKFIILALNKQGQQQLVKIWSWAAKDGFYYEPRLDFQVLKNFWSKDLSLAVPGYDSFLQSNSLTTGIFVPDFSFTEPVFFKEDQNLPFDQLLHEKIDAFCKGKYQVVNTRSIFYNKKEDFRAYMTFRCICNRTTLSKPNLDSMCSDWFSFEKWKEINAS